MPLRPQRPGRPAAETAFANFYWSIASQTHWQTCLQTGRPTGWQRRPSSLGEKLGDLIFGDGPFTNDFPARLFVGQIDDGGRNVARRNAAVDDDADAPARLVVYLF